MSDLAAQALATAIGFVGIAWAIAWAYRGRK